MLRSMRSLREQDGERWKSSIMIFEYVRKKRVYD
jgi:hypothetical protein